MERGLHNFFSGYKATIPDVPISSQTAIATETEIKSRRVSDKLSETMQILANEPSLALYRIEEHIRKTLPQLVEQRKEIAQLQKQAQGRCFDMEYDMGAIRSVGRSRVHLKSIADIMKQSIFLKQQIDYNAQRRLTRPVQYHVYPRSPLSAASRPSYPEQTSSSFSREGGLSGIFLSRARSVDVVRRATLTRSVEITVDFGLSHATPTLEEEEEGGGRVEMSGEGKGMSAAVSSDALRRIGVLPQQQRSGENS